MSFELRPYQHEAVQALLDGWEEGGQRLAVVAPTGSGKTVMFSNLLVRLRRERKIKRMLVVAHREELLDQAAAKIRSMSPSLKVGVVKGNRNNHLNCDVVVASIQTLSYRRPCRNGGDTGQRCNECTRCTMLPRAAQIKGVGAVIVDECHHGAAPSYKRVLRFFGGFHEMGSGGIPVAGFTATMTREEGGLAHVWEKVVYRREIADMMDDGFLVRPHAKQVEVPDLDLDQARTQGGDFTSKSLADLMLDSEAMNEVAKAYQEYASDRKGIIFSPNVAVAEAMTMAFTEVGLPTETVWGAMGTEERRAVLSRFKQGTTQVLSNVMVLTEGFDDPAASCLVVARPTRNAGLYIQMAGRVLRPAPGKEDALILDVTGVTTRHKLASVVDLTGRKGKDADGDADTDEEEEEEEPAPEPESEMGREIEKEVLQVGGWRDVDPDEMIPRFGPARARWLRTPKNYRFVKAGDYAYFMVASIEAGQMHLRVLKDGRVQTPPNDPAVPVEEALNKLEELGLHRMGEYDDMRAPWRKNKPKSAQLDFAHKMKIDGADQMNKGQISDAIDAKKFGRKIDAFVDRHESKLNELRSN